jgi:hypothetical protein
MFGDGVYLAEDMGKSDQYCRPFPDRGSANKVEPLLFQGLPPAPTLLLPLALSKGQ